MVGMAKQMPDDLILAGMVHQEADRREVAELVRREGDAGLSEEGLANGLPQGLGRYRFASRAMIGRTSSIHSWRRSASPVGIGKSIRRRFLVSAAWILTPAKRLSLVPDR